MFNHRLNSINIITVIVVVVVAVVVANSSLVLSSSLSPLLTAARIPLEPSNTENRRQTFSWSRFG